MPTPITTKPSSIASRLKSFGVVHAALTTHSSEATGVLARRKAAARAARQTMDESVLEATEDNTYRELFSHLADELEVAKTEMISANTTHLGQLALIVDLKERRDGLTGILYSKFSKTRRTFETLFGSGRRFPVLAISGDTPSTPTALVAQVRDSVGFLEDPKVATPALDMIGVDLDPPAIARQLADDADELDDVLIAVNKAEKQAQVTRQAKNVAIHGYDRKFLRIARMAESTFHFAGMHELATRVRPSTRRPGRRLADEGGEKAARETDARETEARPVEAQADASGEPDPSSANG